MLQTPTGAFGSQIFHIVTELHGVSVGEWNNDKLVEDVA